MTILLILVLCLIIVFINLTNNEYERHKETMKQLEKNALYTCKKGDYKGQTHDIKDWRKIAIELARTTKNSRINAIAKHGTDEDVIGLLYFNFGVELFDNEIDLQD